MNNINRCRESPPTIQLRQYEDFRHVNVEEIMPGRLEISLFMDRTQNYGIRVQKPWAQSRPNRIRTANGQQISLLDM